MLAEQTGSTFSPPRNAADASRQIGQLKARNLSDRGAVARERRQLQADLASQSGGAARYRASEISGYGSSARWAHGADSEAASDA